MLHFVVFCVVTKFLSSKMSWRLAKIEFKRLLDKPYSLGMNHHFERILGYSAETTHVVDKICMLYIYS